MKNTFDVLPEGLTRSFLKEFGLEWTQLSLLSGVLVSSFSLQKYIHPGAWAIAVIASFGVVYCFRRQLGGNFPRTALLAGLGAAVIFLPGVILLTRTADTTQFLARWRTWTTLYVGFGLCIPLAVTVLSYRRQEMLYGGPYPERIQNAIQACVVQAQFYRVDQLYEVEALRHEEHRVTLRILLSYTVVNRTKVERQYTAQYAASGEHARYLRAELNGERLDVADPDYHRGRGLTIPVNVPAGERVAVLLEAEEGFPDRGSETFTVYAPTTSITLRLLDALPDMRFDCESLLPEKVNPVVDGNTRTFSWIMGVLPFSGFRLHWHALGPPSVETLSEK